MSLRTDSRVIGRHIEGSIMDHLFHRYARSWLGESPMVEVEVQRRIENFTWVIHLIIDKHWHFSVNIDESAMMSTDVWDEWGQYQMQNIQRMVDTAIFMRWFATLLDRDGKVMLTEKCVPLVEQVMYVPPRGCLEQRVDNRFLACIKLKSGQVHRETLDNIKRDPDTLLAMLLMMVP